jgi:hypothetical protein
VKLNIEAAWALRRALLTQLSHGILALPFSLNQYRIGSISGKAAQFNDGATTSCNRPGKSLQALGHVTV